MQKLTIIKDVELKVNGTGVVIHGEEVLGEIVAQPHILQDMMSNEYFVMCWKEIGATHWEVTNEPKRVALVELSVNFYAPPKYHSGE